MEPGNIFPENCNRQLHSVCGRPGLLVVRRNWGSNSSGCFEVAASQHDGAGDFLSVLVLVTPHHICPSSCGTRTQDGAYIRGLFLEGARWDSEQGSLNDSRPKQLYTPLPVIHLDPEQHRKNPEKGVYRCPVYKVCTINYLLGVAVRVRRTRGKGRLFGGRAMSDYTYILYLFPLVDTERVGQPE